MVEVTKAAPSMDRCKWQSHGAFSHNLMWKLSATNVTVKANLCISSKAQQNHVFLRRGSLAVRTQRLYGAGVNENLHTSGDPRNTHEAKYSVDGSPNSVDRVGVLKSSVKHRFVIEALRLIRCYLQCIHASKSSKCISAAQACRICLAGAGACRRCAFLDMV